ncbi:Lipopolysaccharide-assembly [Catalinimonas alkaloidigena]|uniref:Lipopolysaccharide-assembly n=1 Tax=Catalinimonas alkaloidigena TaxID=1075417 RepID=A0A1G8XVA4_9BACT|nr:LptE family protein [Catalinimonas alkaloidigena]SDJ94104.1 Lipopolysaccharide-assembly [Catalinimonas alkaloidigena]
MSRKVVWGALVWASWMLASCGVSYSFTGADIGNAKTISIQTFVDDVGTGPTNLAIRFSENLREFYQRNTSLSLVSDQPGDLQLDGAIVGYDLTPIAPQAGATESAALNRLTIRIEANYVNTLDDTKDFQSTFSAYEDFPQSQDLASVEQELIETITDRIILDIFNKSVANW